MALGVFSFDESNGKYRQFSSSNGILEYTLNGNEITIDWVQGADAAGMLAAVLDFEGPSVTRATGYATDKLGNTTHEALSRLANQIARRLGDDWSATIERIEGRRYLVFMKRE